jgi:transglutaminase-like putative cysteine protease
VAKPQARDIVQPARRHADVRHLACGLLVAFAMAGALAAATPPRRLDEVRALVDAGHFAQAEAAIAAALSQAADAGPDAVALRDERERMRRILLDFGLDREQAIARVRRQVPDLREEEFDRWDAAGLLEKREIDGRVRYFNRAPSNLFRLSPEAFARRNPPTPLVEGPMESANAHHREVIEAALAGGAARRTVRVTQGITVEADAVPAGETIRAWIPYPREIAGQQEGLRLVASTPSAHEVAPREAPMRTVYLEAKAQAGSPTRFEISYELTVLAQYRPAPGAAPAFAADRPQDFVAERAPHVVFTPAIRAFSRQVVGEETDKREIARKLFAAVDRIPWAGALEYSTIPNISEYALRAGHADCGQQTLLLITLLRLNGIPARWQSGMVYSDGDYDNLHDWGWLYLEPEGWIPMDVTTGRLGDADLRVAGFYFGGLDAYRIAFNDDFGQDFVPAKQHLRSDDVDSQRGEVEWRGGNLYFDTWDYDFVARPTKSTGEKP